MMVDDHLCPYKGADCYAREKRFINNISKAAMTNRVTAAFLKRQNRNPEHWLRFGKEGQADFALTWYECFALTALKCTCPLKAKLKPNEVGSILEGGATERVNDGVCSERKNAAANDTKSATTWCRWRGSNPHALARDFKSLVSASSTTPAWLTLMLTFPASPVKAGRLIKPLDIKVPSGYNILINNILKF